MTWQSGRTPNSGYTLVEMVIALSIAFIVVLVIGKMMLTNQSMWKAGNDKVQLQRNLSEVLVRLENSVRNSRSLELVDDGEFRTRDESGAWSHSYRRRRVVGGGYRLQEDGDNLSNWNCIRFECSTNDDTTCLTFVLELENEAGNRITAMTRAAIRNNTLAF